jgi:hypothetical protein
MRRIIGCSVFLFGLLGSANVSASGVADICNSIANYDSAEAVQCASLIGNNTFDANATAICANIASFNGTEAVTCIGDIANHGYDSQAISICSQIESYDSAEALTCLQTIQDKTFPSGTIGVCLNIANSSGSGAVSCLKSIGVSAPVKPACPNEAATSTAIKSALQSLDQYDVVTARKTLLQILVPIENCQ